MTDDLAAIRRVLKERDAIRRPRRRMAAAADSGREERAALIGGDGGRKHAGASAAPSFGGRDAAAGGGEEQEMQRLREEEDEQLDAIAASCARLGALSLSIAEGAHAHAGCAAAPRCASGDPCGDVLRVRAARTQCAGHALRRVREDATER